MRLNGFHITKNMENCECKIDIKLQIQILKEAKNWTYLHSGKVCFFTYADCGHPEEHL